MRGKALRASLGAAHIMVAMKGSQGLCYRDGAQTGSETSVRFSLPTSVPWQRVSPLLPGEGSCLPALSALLPKELPRLGYFILHCPIQKSFQRLQPCQRRACTKGLFDFLFVFICQQRGRGAGEKELLGFKIFIWVVSFWELAPWNSGVS